MVKKLAIGCGGLFLLFVVIGVAASGTRPATVTPGGNQGASATGGAQTAKIGDKVSAGNWEYTVTKIDQQKTVTWSQFGNKTDAKGTWMIVYLTLTNRGNQNFGIGTQDFELVDGGGVKYAADTVTGLSYAEFSKLSKLGFGDQYPPGVAVNTLILFDTNPAATGLRLVPRQAGGASIDLGK